MGMALLAVSFGAVGCSGSRRSSLERAERLRADGRYQEAIAEYEKHIQYRLALKQQNARATAENAPASPASGSSSAEVAPSPYFFALIIGDLYLQLNDPAAAKQAYLRAKENNAEPALVAHKLRYLGHWYEDHGRKAEAMAIYKEFNALDPLLFDMDQDRLYKEQLAPPGGASQP